MPQPPCCCTMVFLSTPSARRATSHTPDSMPRLSPDFYPRPPQGGRLSTKGIPAAALRFLSTPSARRATLDQEPHHRILLAISIHALRKEGDSSAQKRTATKKHFYPRPPQGGRREAVTESGRNDLISIHALRKEGDQMVFDAIQREFQFLSTPSARRATEHPLLAVCSLFDFYPRPPQGGRPAATQRSSSTPTFLSTPSARRATPAPQPEQPTPEISIHALRKEGDTMGTALHGHFRIFLSTPSARRATTSDMTDKVTVTAFLSTPSARRATPDLRPARSYAGISIHALRKEGDLA